MTRPTADGSVRAVPPEVGGVVRLIKRETIMLLALGGIAVAAFFGTRAAARANHRTHRADAARWYAVGQQRLGEHATAPAAAALRRAVALDPEDRMYRLALADALRAGGDVNGARAVLIRVRSLAPEDPRVNIQLARLDADRNPGDALRFYHAGLEALWEPEHEDARRRLRVEIVTFLLDRGSTSRALSEVLALASDLPDTPAAHTEAGRLFLRAGDPARALQQFLTALQAAPRLTDARLGAARAAFELGEYRSSSHHLRHVPNDEREAADLRDLVDRILAIDPLVRGLSAAERRHRLSAALTDVLDRTERCRAVLCGPDRPTCAELTALTSGTLPLQRLTKKPRRYASHDNVESDLAAIGALSARTSAACGVGTTTARALSLVVRQYGLNQP